LASPQPPSSEVVEALAAANYASATGTRKSFWENPTVTERTKDAWRASARVQLEDELLPLIRKQLLDEVREGLQKEVEASRQFVIYGTNVVQLQGESLTEREMVDGLIVINRGVVTRTLAALDSSDPPETEVLERDKGILADHPERDDAAAEALIAAADPPETQGSPPEIPFCDGNCLRRMEPGPMGEPPRLRTWWEDLERYRQAAIARRNEAKDRYTLSQLEELLTGPIRKLWEAATENWYEVDEETGEPIPLGDLLFDSATALPGIPIKGKELYRIGLELGLIAPIKGEGR
jgi:hypothetical protein